jgi:hypothetical protein
MKRIGRKVETIPRVRVFHWRAEEAGPLIDAVRSAGYSVDYPNARGLAPPFRTLRDSPPHAIVIDLTRLPAHGRNQAVAIRGQEPVRRIPLVFVDGDPAKVAKIRAELPDAIYTTRVKIGAALKRAKPPANPASPPYSKRTTAQKLLIQERMGVAVIDAPFGYAQAVGPLPTGAWFEEEPGGALPVTLWFVRDPETYLGLLPRIRTLAAKTRLWIVYARQGVARKGRSEGVSALFVLDAARAVGLSPYKSCSINDSWGALLVGRSRKLSSRA